MKIRYHYAVSLKQNKVFVKDLLGVNRYLVWTPCRSVFSLCNNFAGTSILNHETKTFKKFWYGKGSKTPVYITLFCLSDIMVIFWTIFCVQINSSKLLVFYVATDRHTANITNYNNDIKVMLLICVVYCTVLKSNWPLQKVFNKWKYPNNEINSKNLLIQNSPVKYFISQNGKFWSTISTKVFLK